MIELQDIVQTIGGRRVVDHVTLTIPPGAFCALVGSSGAGKSTTLKMINRLIAPTSGTIRIGGEDVTQIAPETLRRRIGYVIQSIGLFPHWTVADNIATVPRLLDWPQRRIDARIDELLDLMRLDRRIYRDKYPRQLSGGQQQRIGIARALAADPELLLMDEPFGALDPITREALAHELALIHQRTGKTIVFVTHDIDMALQLADIVAIMNDGKLVQAAAPLDILQHPANDFVRDFIGRQGLGLKLMSLRRVAELVRPGVAAEGESITPETTLTEALSQMVERHADRLPVRAAGGAEAGAVVLSDLVR